MGGLRNVRNGALDLEELFTRQDVTAKVKAIQDEVKKELARQKKMLNGKQPDIDIGAWCDDPYSCDFKKSGLKAFLKKLSYPIYFLDFETFMGTMPLCDGMCPYQQIPFQ